MRKLCKVILRKEITDEAGSYKQEKENSYNAYSSFVCDSGCIFCCFCYQRGESQVQSYRLPNLPNNAALHKNLTDLGSKSDDIVGVTVLFYFALFIIPFVTYIFSKETLIDLKTKLSN